MIDKLRNIAIIAHVDHGKTTLVDKLLSQSGTLDRRNQDSERIMDSNDQEKERGITILAKNTETHVSNASLNDLRINVMAATLSGVSEVGNKRRPTTKTS